MSILYSKSNLSQKFLQNKLLDESTTSFKNFLNKCNEMPSFDYFNIDSILENTNKSSSSNYLLISDKEPLKNEILFKLDNNSTLIYWHINESCVPHDEINLKRIKYENSNFYIKEITLIDNGLNLKILSGSPLKVIDVLFNCEEYNTQSIIDKMVSLYI